MASYTPAAGRSWLTPLYDIGVRVTMPERAIRAKLADFVDPQPGQRILEFGYGTGSNLIRLYERCPSTSLAGVDLDPRIHARATARLGEHNASADLLLYDGRVLPFENAAFDTVFSCLVFHHLTPDAKRAALGELLRVLRPGGRLIVGDWGAPSSPLMKAASGFIRLIDGGETTAENLRGELPRLIEEAGFREVRELEVINTAVGTFRFLRSERGSTREVFGN